MSHHSLLLFCCLTILAVPLAAQDDAKRMEFVSLVAANTYPISFADGRIAGEGLTWLVEEANAAQYFLIGERHATADIADLSAALFEALVPVGYHHAALEFGPFAGKKAEELLRSGGYEALKSFLETPETYQAIAFLDWAEEAQLAARVVDASPVKEGALWGLDQEFVFGMGMHLNTLDELASKDAQRQILTTLRAAYEDERFAMASTDPAVIQELKGLFQETNTTEAVELVDALLFANHVYGRFLGKISASQSNTDRENYMKDNLVDFVHAREAKTGAAPKVFFKFGGFHSAPSIDSDGAMSLGTFVESWARSRDETAFNIYMDCNGGLHRASGQDSSTGGDSEQPCTSYFGSIGADAESRQRIHIFNDLLAENNDILLIDLRPLKKQLGEWSFLDNRARKLIAGFDAYLALPNVSAATPFEMNK